MKKIIFFRKIFALLVVLCTFLVCTPVMAQNSIVNGIDLGVRELTLEVGESYTFDVKFAAGSNTPRLLSWFATDDSVISIDSHTDTITALNPGTVRIYAESFDNAYGTYCDVLVTGGIGKDASELVSGEEFVGLSESDMAKIDSKPFNNFLAFVNSSEFSSESFEKISERFFRILAEVVPGTEAEESAKARALGMANSDALIYLNMVTLEGTFAQILDYMRDNSNVTSIFGGELTFIVDPTVDDSDQAAKTVTLEDHVEEITQVSIAHNLGYTGQGATIAIIDTGLNSSHEQFTGRVIREKCYSSSGPDGSATVYSVCENNALEADSAEPAGATKKSKFNHGSHVAGIAAGIGGIAPDANIVAVQAFSEVVWRCRNTDDIRLNSCSDVFGSDMCCGSSIYKTDEFSAYDYLAGLNQSGVTIDVVNMSYGFASYDGTCDSNETQGLQKFSTLVNQGTIPVAATGNNANVYNGVMYPSMINYPACLSNVFSVGNMADRSDLKIRWDSNHSTVMDILAPGSKIRSALYVDDGNSTSNCTNGNCYGYMWGTSMASPMVSGAFAILKSAIPGKTPAQYERIMLDMSQNKTANEREDGSQRWNYNKPVLNFVNFESIVEKYNKPGPEPGPEPDPGQEIDLYPIDYWPELPELPRTGITGAFLPEKPVDLNYKNLNWNVQIPTISVSADIVEVPFRDDEYAVTWLGDKAGLLAGFPMPGRGTTVIAGHNHLNAEEAGPFAMLQFVKEGDRIFIQSPDNSNTTYIVYANEKIEETDFAAFDRIAGARKNAVVFITCEDERVDGGYANRRIVAAMPE